MRPALSIALRDVRATYGSPFGYLLTAGFLALSGILLVLALRAGEARLDGWFSPLFVFSGMLASLLTMRSFAEEERTGSLELLLTAPVRLGQVVVGKLIGVTLVFTLVVCGTAVAPLLVAAMGDPDGGPILTGYLGLLLAGVAFLAVGLAASAATASQLVASATSAGVLLGLWFVAGLADGLGGRPRVLLEYLSPSTHIVGFLRGTISAADVTYFLSLVVVGVVTTLLVVRGRK